MSELSHIPVLLEECLEALAPRSGGVYVDATLGRAGHSRAILDASAPDGRLVAIDRDATAVIEGREKLASYGARAEIVHSDFGRIPDVLAELGITGVEGILADIGVSSPQLDDPERGFSFRREGPLDMRMDTSYGETALEMIDRLPEDELADVIYQLGEERKSRPIARRIKEALADDELRTTDDLRRAVHRATGGKRGRIDPATRTFQALRIAVNAELEQLERLIAAIPDLLVDGGVAAIISFHSLEDRIVKWAFRNDDRLEPLSKRPIVATEEERAKNPRSRSAKLRTARRVPREEAAA